MTNTIKLILIAALLGGCAPRIATVAPPQPPKPELGAQDEVGVRTQKEQADRCERTSDAAWWLRTTSGAMVVAAGAEGAGAIPVDDPDVARGLAIGAGITAGTAAVLGYWGQSLEKRYADECVEGDHQ